MKRRINKLEKSKNQNDNLYKALGIRSNASQERIKEKYIEKVKEFTPEDNPEEFQQIREAYEILKDPIKRGKYDILNKYGGKIKRIMQKAHANLQWGELEKAEELAEEAQKLAPNNVEILLLRAHIAIGLGDELTFNNRMDDAERLIPRNDKLQMLLIKAGLLLDEEYKEEALSVLVEAEKLDTEGNKSLKWLFLRTYEALEQYDQVWERVQLHIPTADEQAPEHVSIFIKWTNAMINLEKWQEKAKIKVRVRKFLKSLKNEDDRYAVLHMLRKECTSYTEVARFREAEMFLNFIYCIDKCVEVKDELQENQKLMQLSKEIYRLFDDEDIFPLVFIRAYELYNDLVTPDRDISEVTNQFSVKKKNEFKKMKSEYAAGILRVKKKYPLIYREFKEEWEALFKEYTDDLNRESRRQLR